MKLPALLDRALRLLGIRNFQIGIHDAAFPSLAAEDLGCGSPYTDGAAAFLQFVADLGFNGVQLGPQGITTPANASPYDGTLFSRNPLSLAPLALTREPCCLLDREEVARLVEQRPGDSLRVNDRFARWAQSNLTELVCRRYRQELQIKSRSACTALDAAYRMYRQKNRHWLDRDALYQVLRQQYGGKTWQDWGNNEQALLDKRLFAPEKGREKHHGLRLDTLNRHYAKAIDNYSFVQFLLAEQHRRLRDHCRRLGLQLFGDFQVGMSGRDAWYAQSFLLPDYVMGAPPSRTNPQGQPWNYPVLDPRHYYATGDNGQPEPGAALRFVRQRLEKMAGEFDGLRLDHPHGLICPWVYKKDQIDPLYAVQHGARLFASPLLTDHPSLTALAIVRPEQLNYRVFRYSDEWVTDLEPAQINQYGQLFAVIMDTLNRRRGSGRIACEILSTQPYPVKRVLELYGLGRFRVTQKADLTNVDDVYRGENAQPEDWLMLGNHDTAPVWQVAEQWVADGSARCQAEYLATRLAIPKAGQKEWVHHLAGNAAALVQAKFAELFVGPAQNIMVFFVDLLGGKETYNRPGTVSHDNWSLRIPEDYEKSYREKIAANRALNIPAALTMALRAGIHSGRLGDTEHHEVLQQLERVK